MSFEEFLTSKIGVSSFTKTKCDPKVSLAESLAMDMADPPPPAGMDFLYRDDWLAFTPVRRRLMPTPVRHIRLTQTGGKSCDSRDSCVERVRGLQEKHVADQGLEDIAYNFLVDHEGRVFEGRGWHVRAERSAELHYLDNNCVDICVIGKCKIEPLPEPTLKAVGDLIKFGVENNLLKESYILLGYKEYTEVQEEMKRREKKRDLRINKKDRNKQYNSFEDE